MRAKDFVSERRRAVGEEPDSSFGNQVANVIGNAIKKSPIGSAIDVVDNIGKGDVGGAVGSAVNLAGKTVGYAMGGLPGLAVGTALDTAGDVIKKTTAAPAPSSSAPLKQKKIQEASGHIPKNDREAKDPRWSNAITVDIHPGSSREQAEKMGWRVDADGIPPKLSTSGLLDETSMDVGVQARQPISPGAFGLMRSSVDYGLSVDSKSVIRGAVDALADRIKHKCSVDFEIQDVASKFNMSEKLLTRAFEKLKKTDPHEYSSRAIAKAKKSPIRI